MFYSSPSNTTLQDPLKRRINLEVTHSVCLLPCNPLVTLHLHHHHHHTYHRHNLPFYACSFCSFSFTSTSSIPKEHQKSEQLRAKNTVCSNIYHYPFFGPKPSQFILFSYITCNTRQPAPSKSFYKYKLSFMDFH